MQGHVAPVPSGVWNSVVAVPAAFSGSARDGVSGRAIVGLKGPLDFATKLLYKIW